MYRLNTVPDANPRMASLEVPSSCSFPVGCSNAQLVDRSEIAKINRCSLITIVTSLPNLAVPADVSVSTTAIVPVRVTSFPICQRRSPVLGADADANAHVVAVAGEIGAGGPKSRCTNAAPKPAREREAVLRADDPRR